VRSSHLHQPRRQLGSRPLAQHHSLFGPEGGGCQSRALPRHPVGVTLNEGIGLAPGSTARNSDAHATIMLDA
jgi:hypothetical protein